MADERNDASDGPPRNSGPQPADPVPEPTNDRGAGQSDDGAGPDDHGKMKKPDPTPKEETRGKEAKTEEEDKESKKAKSRFAVISDEVKAFSTILTHSILILALVGCIFVVIREWRSSGVLLDQIEVPEGLQKKGITPNAVSQRLLDEIRRMQQESGESSARRRLFEPSWTREKEDIQVPGGNFSIRAAVQFFKKQFGYADPRIGGELRENSDQSLQLVLRTTESGVIFNPKIESIGKLDEIFRPGSMEILKKTDPYLLASYWFTKELKSGHFTETHNAIKYSLVEDYKSTASRAYNLLGNIYANQGNLAEAIENYQRSTQEAKPFAVAYLNWGDALIMLGKYAAAKEKYDLAASMEPALAGAANGRGVALTNVANYRKAAVYFRAAAERDSDWVWPHINLADVYSNLGNRGGMLAEYRIAAKLAERQLLVADSKSNLSGEDSDLADLYVAWGHALLGLSAQEAAREKFEKAAKINSRSIDAQYGWGASLLALGKYKEANERFEAATQIHPRFAVAHSAAGDVFTSLGDYARAKEQYATAFSINPNFLEAHYGLGNLLFETGDHVGGNKIYKRATMIAPNAEVVHYKWANSLVSAGNYAEAVSKYRDALRINPEFAPAYVGWGNALNASGSYGASVAKYRRAIDLSPSLADAYVGWGNALASLQNRPEAVDKYRKATDLVPDTASGYAAWGDILVSQGDYEDAIVKYRDALKIDPRSVTAYNGWGGALAALGRTGEASEKYNRAIDLVPSSLDAYARLGDMQFLEGDVAGGNKQYDRAYQINRSSPWLLNSWASQLSDRAEDDDAIARYEEAINVNPAYIWPITKSCELVARYRRLRKGERAFSAGSRNRT